MIILSYKTVHHRCYWCGGLVSDEQGISRVLSSTTVWWHSKCAPCDPLFPHDIHAKEPVMNFAGDRWLDE
jgi:hypothetical protein